LLLVWIATREHYENESHDKRIHADPKWIAFNGNQSIISILPPHGD
jgi:hypothetical protein